MKKIYTIQDVVYTIKPIEVEVEKVDTIEEHVEVEKPITESKMEALFNAIEIDEVSESMKAIIGKQDFKSLFGPKTKPRKGDILSITKLAKQYKVKKAKKFSAKKKGKGYKLSLTTV